MRVALTLEQCWHRVPGGTATSVLDLVRGLAARDDVEPIGVAGRHKHPPAEPYRPVIDVKHLPFSSRVLYRTWPQIGWPDVEWATGSVDVAHSTTIIVAGSRAPAVVTIHDVAWRHAPEHFTRRGVRVFEQGLAVALRTARLVVVPSEASAADCRAAGFTDTRVRVVPWGYDAPAVTADDRDRVRSVHGLDQPYVLFTGTIEPRKNLGRLIEAFGRLGRADLELVVAGPDGWHTDFEALAGQTPNVRRLGFVAGDDLPALYAGATVFAAPSLREGFGLPVLEAMAQGTSVVTSAGTSTAETVADAGVLVDPLDVASITAGLERALDQPELGTAARARAQEFTVARCAEGYMQAYRDAMS